MMEMIEERQQLSNNDIHERVERVLNILHDEISAPVTAVYKEKLNATLDFNALRGMLEAIAPELPKDGLDDTTLLEQLDLNAWLSLILGRWALFEPILKNTGRNAVQTLKDVHSGWASEHKFISLRDARNIASSAHELLVEFDRKEAAKKIGDIRDELQELIKKEESAGTDEDKNADHVATVPAHNRWLSSTHENAEKAAIIPGNHTGARVDRNRTKQIKPPSNLLFLRLEIVEKNGAASAQTIDLKKPNMIIGRSQMADVELNDPLVSRIHLLISGTTPYNVKVTDLNSTNGSHLDGAPLKPNEAVYWDVGKPLVVGETWMILRQS